MVYQTEPLDMCYKDIEALIHRYYNAQPEILDGMPKIEMDWEHYRTLAANNMLFIMVCRKADRYLSGCAVYVVGKHPHYLGKCFAYCDTLAVDPPDRSKGIASALVRGASLKLKEIGVQFMTHSSRTVYERTPLFPKLGFRLTEQTFIKELV